ncbi:hypothetical protein [Desulfonatronospira sp.]|uniref:hypothetical protein n=1 Tax=Desulfonatronospira sp. TaxID=1962951 RepID=UPI0025C1923E|nr:hypothetical protein [Desulfonatronospira sp.]
MSKEDYFPIELIRNSPLNYKWNEDIAIKLYYVDNLRLFNAINLSSFRMKMALGALITDLIICRLSPFCDTSDAQKRTDAAWAAVIDPLYVFSLKIELSTGNFDDREPILGTLESCLKLLDSIYTSYNKGDIYLADPIMCQAWLARHISPNKKVFDNWLKDTLRISAKYFPREQEYDKSTEKFDYSNEIPVSPYFFIKKRERRFEDNIKDINLFLSNLEPINNPYLRSPNEMIKHGFVGIPYKYGFE